MCSQGVSPRESASPSPEHVSVDQLSDVNAFRVAQEIVEHLTARGETLATAESLTGGMVSAAIVDVAGASNCLRGGVTTYQTHTKADVLGVDREHLAHTGPVDPLVAKQMAKRVAELFDADFGISTTGVAGPGPSDGHEAGTVYVGAWDGVKAHEKLYHFTGERSEIRAKAVKAALLQLKILLQEGNSPS